jgi:hypothetical protein
MYRNTTASEVRAIPIYILSQSGMSLIKLLKFCGTRNLLDWYTNYFCPTFFRFVKRMCFQPRLLDNAPSHPTKLVGVRNGSIVYLPSNTTSLLQPVDHGLIAAFRAYSSKPSWQW